jgi:diphthamide synthase (EF-2-diphthine--ammonia ligase)
MTQKAVLCWSGGKDSARALYEVRLGGQYEIVSLLSTVTRDYDRVSMHGVRTALIEEQARKLGLPLEKAFISAGATTRNTRAVCSQNSKPLSKQGSHG